MRVLILASHCDRDDVGESFNAYKWVSGLAEFCDVTLLSQYRWNRVPPSEQIPRATVIEWLEPSWFSQFERFNAMAKPWYPHYYIRTRQVIRRLLRAGHQFDIIHHLTPIAIRYPAPCQGFKIPYLVGPLSGGVSTPQGMSSELSSAPIYTRLRLLDGLRLQIDPMLRRSFAEADMVIGAAPYIKERLASVPLQAFDVECEVGIEELATVRQKSKSGEPLRLLYVGRAIRSKGLRDAVRAIARLSGKCDATLTAAGAGEDLELCQKEASTLGVANRFNFLGPVDRASVERLYACHDAFIFPSFREPTGGVLLEAMRYGLPIITTNIGGPNYIVNEQCGIKVEVKDPEQFAQALADAICQLSADEVLRDRLGRGAQERVSEIGLWGPKIGRMVKRYQQIIDCRKEISLSVPHLAGASILDKRGQ
jgi:glycosyltransferase involved in cell wall biosynthesis